MSKFNLKGANISAKSVHIGDTYTYSSPDEFLKINNSKKFTKTERELVELIFENTSSDEERIKILESLKSIKDENLSTNEKKGLLVYFKPLLKTLKAKGRQVAIEFIQAYVKEKLNSIDLDLI